MNNVHILNYSKKYKHKTILPGNCLNYIIFRKLLYSSNILSGYMVSKHCISFESKIYLSKINLRIDNEYL